jgi:hypothetical protein
MSAYFANPTKQEIDAQDFTQRIADYKAKIPFLGVKFLKPNETTEEVFENIDTEGIVNIKEIRSFPLLESIENIPPDVFNTVCDNIINEIVSIKNLSFTSFRDTLYDILTYNLEMSDCLWFIIKHFIEDGSLSIQDTSDILVQTHTFLKYFNNNYRPIYHLESIMFYIINKIHKFK